MKNLWNVKPLKVRLRDEQYQREKDVRVEDEIEYKGYAIMLVKNITGKYAVKLFGKDGEHLHDSPFVFSSKSNAIRNARDDITGMIEGRW